MSKRGSKNSLKFADKSWGLSKMSPTPDADKLKKEKEKEDAKKKRKENKRKSIKNQFQTICKKFNFEITETNSFLHSKLERTFCEIGSSKIRIKTIQNIKSFKLYCIKYKETFTIEKYFEKKYYLTDFKKEYPDVYFFNVYKPELSKIKNSNQSKDTLENNITDDIKKKLRNL